METYIYFGNIHKIIQNFFSSAHCTSMKCSTRLWMSFISPETMILLKNYIIYIIIEKYYNNKTRRKGCRAFNWSVTQWVTSKMNRRVISLTTSNKFKNFTLNIWQRMASESPAAIINYTRNFLVITHILSNGRVNCCYKKCEFIRVG